MLQFVLSLPLLLSLLLLPISLDSCLYGLPNLLRHLRTHSDPAFAVVPVRSQVCLNLGDIIDELQVTILAHAPCFGCTRFDVNAFGCCSSAHRLVSCTWSSWWWSACITVARYISTADVTPNILERQQPVECSTYSTA